MPNSSSKCMASHKNFIYVFILAMLSMAHYYVVCYFYYYDSYCNVVEHITILVRTFVLFAEISFET